MPDIVITAGRAVGSVLILAETITTSIGCKAYILCTDKKTSKILASSRFVEDVVYINASSEVDYIDEIKSWYKKVIFKEKPLLYFTTDTSCFYIDNYRDWFEKNFEMCLPSSNIVQVFTQKGLAEVQAAESGLVIPKTQIIKSNVDVDMVLSKFQFPIILKPRATYFKNNVDFKIKVIKSKNKFIELIDIYIKNDIILLCQEYVPGGDNTSYYYLFYRDKEGCVFESMGNKTLQSTPNGGIMLKGTSKFDLQLSSMSKEFLKNIDYQGIGGIEFKKYNGKFYFIEMSVRLEGFFKLSEMSDVPLGLISYLDITKKNMPSSFIQYNQKNNVKYIDFIPTFSTHINNKSYMLAVVDMLSIFFNPNVKINVFSFKSCKPFFNQIVDLFKK